MKNNKLKLSLIMLCVLFLFSCKKDNSTNDGGSQTFNVAFVR